MSSPGWPDNQPREPSIGDILSHDTGVATDFNIGPYMVAAQKHLAIGCRPDGGTTTVTVTYGVLQLGGPTSDAIVTFDALHTFRCIPNQGNYVHNIAFEGGGNVDYYVALANLVPFDGEEEAVTSNIRPYVQHNPTIEIPGGTDPDGAAGSFYISMPEDPIPGTDPMDVALFQGSVTIVGAAGVVGPGFLNQYVISPIVFPTSDFGWTNGTVGAGWTAPGGVPYPCYLVQSGLFGKAAILVTGVADPDAATYFYRARPLWPGTYVSGDTLFEGIANINVRVD